MKFSLQTTAAKQLVRWFCALSLTVHAVKLQAQTPAANITYTGKDVPLVTIFQEIREQTGYTVLAAKNY